MKRARSSLNRPATAPAINVGKKGSLESNFNVSVRVRPPNRKERDGPYYSVIEVADEHVLTFDSKASVTADCIRKGLQRDVVGRPRCKDLRLAFDRVFPQDANQEQVYESTAKLLVDDVMSGYNATCFAYGATGAGKTYTMMGDAGSEGVMVRTLRDVFQKIASDKDHKYNVSLSYVEIYNEIVVDLLSKSDHLDIRDDGEKGIVLAGVSEHHPSDTNAVFKLLEQGQQRRTTSATNANAVSSRSHAVLQVVIQRESIGTVKSVCFGKLSLVDLAGSERAAATKNHGGRLVEGANINKSLLALGNCINALVEGHKHVPYRDSKLTRLLKDSLGGNCRTVMIANVSPSSMTYDDTHNTLHYANRAKNIKTQKDENQRLKKKLRLTQANAQVASQMQLQMPDSDGHMPSSSTASVSAAGIDEDHDQEQKRLFDEFCVEVKVCFEERGQISDGIAHLKQSHGQGQGMPDPEKMARAQRLLKQNTEEIASLKVDVKSRLDNQFLRSALLQTINAYQELHKAKEANREYTMNKQIVSRLARRLADAASSHGLGDLQRECTDILSELNLSGVLVLESGRSHSNTHKPVSAVSVPMPVPQSQSQSQGVKINVGYGKSVESSSTTTTSTSVRQPTASHSLPIPQSIPHSVKLPPIVRSSSPQRQKQKLRSEGGGESGSGDSRRVSLPSTSVSWAENTLKKESIFAELEQFKQMNDADKQRRSLGSARRSRPRPSTAAAVAAAASSSSGAVGRRSDQAEADVPSVTSVSMNKSSSSSKNYSKSQSSTARMQPLKRPSTASATVTRRQSVSGTSSSSTPKRRRNDSSSVLKSRPLKSQRTSTSANASATASVRRPSTASSTTTSSSSSSTRSSRSKRGGSGRSTTVIGAMKRAVDSTKVKVKSLSELEAEHDKENQRTGNSNYAKVPSSKLPLPKARSSVRLNVNLNLNQPRPATASAVGRQSIGRVGGGGRRGWSLATQFTFHHMAEVAKAIDRYRGNVVLALQLLRERQNELNRQKNENVHSTGDAISTDRTSRTSSTAANETYLKSVSKEAEQTRLLLHVIPLQLKVVALQEKKLSLFDAALTKVLADHARYEREKDKDKERSEHESESNDVEMTEITTTTNTNNVSVTMNGYVDGMLGTKDEDGETGDNDNDHVLATHNHPHHTHNKDHDVLSDVLEVLKNDEGHISLEKALRESQKLLNSAEIEHEAWIKAAKKVSEFRGRKLAELDVLRDSVKKALGSTNAMSFIDQAVSDQKSKEGNLISAFVSNVYRDTSVSTGRNTRNRNAAFSVEDAPSFICTIARMIVDKYPARMKEDFECIDDALQSVEIALENQLYPQMYKRVFARFQDSEADEAISKKCIEFKSITQSQLSIEKKYQSSDLVPFAVSIYSALLKSSLLFAMTPSRKLSALLDAAHAILSTADQNNADPMGGDAFIDIFIYCVVHANPPNLQSTINFIEHFALDHLMQGEFGYYFSSLQVAAAFIRDLTSEKLVVSEHMKNKRFAVAEGERFLGWTQRDSHLELYRYRVKVHGYRVYCVLDYVFDPSKLRCAILEKTNNDEDVTYLTVLSTNRTTTELQNEFLKANFFTASPFEPYTTVVEEKEKGLGSILVSDVSKIPKLSFEKSFSSSFRPRTCMVPMPMNVDSNDNDDGNGLCVVRIPNGDFDAFSFGVKLRLTLIRLNCCPATTTTTNTATNMNLSDSLVETDADKSEVSECESESVSDEGGVLLRVSREQIDQFRSEYSSYSHIHEHMTKNTTVDVDMELKSLAEDVKNVVRRIQISLRHLGHYPILAPTDGVFGNLTVAAIESANRMFKEMPNPTHTDCGVICSKGLAWLENEVRSVQKNLNSIGFGINNNISNKSKQIEGGGEGENGYDFNYGLGFDGSSSLSCDFDAMDEDGMKIFSSFVSRFQKHYGLTFPDGVAGAKTRSVLRSVIVEEIQKQASGSDLVCGKVKGKGDKSAASSGKNNEEEDVDMPNGLNILN